MQREIPHGSALGPLHFLFYKNDLENATDSEIVTFADGSSTLQSESACVKICQNEVLSAAYRMHFQRSIYYVKTPYISRLKEIHSFACRMCQVACKN